MYSQIHCKKIRKIFTAKFIVKKIQKFFTAKFIVKKFENILNPKKCRMKRLRDVSCIHLALRRLWDVSETSHVCIWHWDVSETSQRRLKDVSCMHLGLRRLWDVSRRLETSQCLFWDVSRRLMRRLETSHRTLYAWYVPLRTCTYRYVQTVQYVPVRTGTYRYVKNGQDMVRTSTYLYVKNGQELCNGTYLCTYRYVHYNVVWSENYPADEIHPRVHPFYGNPSCGWKSIRWMDSGWSLHPKSESIHPAGWSLDWKHWMHPFQIKDIKEKFLQIFFKNQMSIIHFVFWGKKPLILFHRIKRNESVFLWFCQFLFGWTRKICCFFSSERRKFRRRRNRNFSLSLPTSGGFLFVFLTTTSVFFQKISFIGVSELRNQR